MTSEHGFQEHWLDIDAERMARYEAMFQWNPATEHFYAAAEIGEGQVIADFGCGPGHAAIEFAKWVGPTGHVHAVDINEEFVARARTRARKHGLEKRITAHLLEDARFPLLDASVDRVITRNTIVYIEDPLFTFTEFRRSLRPGGIAHAIEGDWRLTAVEPVPSDEWQSLIDAASWTWPRPEIGRELYGIAREAGFRDVGVQVLTNPDTTGRLMGMIDTVADYARRSGTLRPEQIDSVIKRIKESIKDGKYLAIVPQFIVTAKA
jgi:SAM-dependent methyltransferase